MHTHFSVKTSISKSTRHLPIMDSCSRRGTMQGFCHVCIHNINRKCSGKDLRRTDAASSICSQLLGLLLADLPPPLLSLPYQTNIIYIMLRDNFTYGCSWSRGIDGGQTGQWLSNVVPVCIKGGNRRWAWRSGLSKRSKQSYQSYEMSSLKSGKIEGRSGLSKRSKQSYQSYEMSSLKSGKIEGRSDSAASDQSTSFAFKEYSLVGCGENKRPMLQVLPVITSQQSL